MSKREVVKNHLARAWQEGHYIENIPFISTGILAGVLCCLYAMLFSNVENLAIKLLHENAAIFFIVSPLFLPLALYLVQKFSAGSGGSGIPQIIVCVEKSNSHLRSRFLGFQVIVVKVLSSVVGIFAGAAIGREGPSLQISASVANLLGQFFAQFNIKVRMEQLLIAGAASGLAAAFNTPIGGVVYAIEELSQDHIRSYKNVLLISVVISGITAQLMIGNYLYLGLPQVSNYLDLETIFAILFTAFFSGVLGSFFSLLLIKLISWRKRKDFKMQLWISFFVGLLLAGILYFFGERAAFSGKESINFVLFNQGEVSWTEMTLRFFTPLISSMTGIAGGIFAPSLSAGASLGGYLSEFFDPSIRTLLGLSGMIGFLTGVTRTPITAFILVLEMTDRHSAVFPMMLAAVFSSLSTYLVGNPSFYEASVEMIKWEEKSPEVR